MFADQYALWLVLILSGYFLGSCLFSAWLAMLVHKKDITQESSDGNPGAANVFMLCGWQLGILCVLLDMAKGFVPVFLGIRYFDFRHYFFPVLMLAPVAGHAWSAFCHFQGGKCIASIFGEMVALFWISPIGWILAGLYILFSTVFKISPTRKRSILVFTLFAIFAFIIELYASRYTVAVGCLLVSSVAIYKHLRSPKSAHASVPVLQKE